jgi:hypothetical protein
VEAVEAVVMVIAALLLRKLLRRQALYREFVLVWDSLGWLDTIFLVHRKGKPSSIPEGTSPSHSQSREFLPCVCVTQLCM